ncbi:hypothetical protein V2J09_021936 [Rumex salicifolius]
MAKTGGSSGTKKTKLKKNSSKAGLLRVQTKALKSAPLRCNNPFETVGSSRRCKFEILGKKRKGEVDRRVGVSRSRSIDKRDTLLREFEQTRKASQFVDKRIGELNPSLNGFDKIVLRSQRHRKVSSSMKYKYNLSDGEEDVGIFSGFGEEIGPNDDAVVGYKGLDIKWGIRKCLARSLAEEDENEQNIEDKTRREIMKERVELYKSLKDLKKMEKNKKELYIEELDNEFKFLVQSEALVSITHPGKMNALEALVNPGISLEVQFKKNEGSFSVNSAFTEQERPDAYDRLFNEMKLDARAKGSDRKKTDKEIAEEEIEQIKQWEQERQQRMLASHDDNSDWDDIINVDADKPRPISGDDLGDSFNPDEKRGTESCLADAYDCDGGNSDDGESDEDDGKRCDEENEGETDEESKGGNNEIENLKGWEQSDDELVADLASEKDEDVNQHGSDNNEKLNSQQQEMAITLKSKMKQEACVVSEREKRDPNLPLAHQRELPLFIEAPNNMEDIDYLFGNRSNKEILEAIKSIRITNAIALAADNRRKMQVFYGLLLQYFATLATKPPLNFELLNLLVKPLMEMSVEIPYYSAICARERLLRTRKLFSEDAKDPEKSCWPSLKTLLLLRLWSLTYPCSDFRHTVMTPAILLMCEYLMCCRILSGRDAATGSFLCSMLLSVCKQSQKFCPEPLLFLRSLLMTFLDKDLGSYQESQALYHLLELKASRSLMCIKNRVDEISPLDFLHIMDLPDELPYFSSDEFRASVLVSVVETLRGFVDAYIKLEAFPELFVPIFKLLVELSNQQSLEGPLLDKVKGLADLIKEAVDKQHDVRLPIEMGKKKAPMIQFLTPKYEDSFVKGRDYDPDRERAESRKLKKLVKEEHKGAIREIKKDNTFLHELKVKEKAQLEEERVEKYGKALAFLQEQEHAAKSGQLGKGRKRRR